MPHMKRRKELYTDFQGPAGQVIWQDRHLHHGAVHVSCLKGEKNRNDICSLQLADVAGPKRLQASSRPPSTKPGHDIILQKPLQTALLASRDESLPDLHHSIIESCLTTLLKHRNDLLRPGSRGLLLVTSARVADEYYPAIALPQPASQSLICHGWLSHQTCEVVIPEEVCWVILNFDCSQSSKIFMPADTLCNALICREVQASDCQSPCAGQQLDALASHRYYMSYSALCFVQAERQGCEVGSFAQGTMGNFQQLGPM